MTTSDRKVTKLAINSAIDADYSTKVRNQGTKRFGRTRIDFAAELKINPDGTLTY